MSAEARNAQCPSEMLHPLLRATTELASIIPFSQRTHFEVACSYCYRHRYDAHVQ